MNLAEKIHAWLCLPHAGPLRVARYPDYLASLRLENQLRENAVSRNGYVEVLRERNGQYFFSIIPLEQALLEQRLKQSYNQIEEFNPVELLGSFCPIEGHWFSPDYVVYPNRK